MSASSVDCGPGRHYRRPSTRTLQSGEVVDVSGGCVSDPGMSPNSRGSPTRRSPSYVPRASAVPVSPRSASRTSPVATVRVSPRQSPRSVSVTSRSPSPRSNGSRSPSNGSPRSNGSRSPRSTNGTTTSSRRQVIRPVDGVCEPGTYLVEAHMRKAYTSKSGKRVAAKLVEPYCHPIPAGKPADYQPQHKQKVVYAVNGVCQDGLVLRRGNTAPYTRGGVTYAAGHIKDTCVEPRAPRPRKEGAKPRGQRVVPVNGKCDPGYQYYKGYTQRRTDKDGNVVTRNVRPSCHKINERPEKVVSAYSVDLPDGQRYTIINEDAINRGALSVSQARNLDATRAKTSDPRASEILRADAAYARLLNQLSAPEARPDNAPANWKGKKIPYVPQLSTTTRRNVLKWVADQKGVDATVALLNNLAKNYWAAIDGGDAIIASDIAYLGGSTPRSPRVTPRRGSLY